MTAERSRPDVRAASSDDCTYYSGDATIGLGDQGSPVKEAQCLLVADGYPVIIDGDFGEATVQAVEAFQTANDLPASGQVDPATWGALRG